MQIKCVNIVKSDGLTVDKVYTAIRETTDYFTVVNDDGITKAYHKRRFVTV